MKINPSTEGEKKKDWDRSWRLIPIMKGLSLKEEVRLIKIILELLKINGIPLDFLEDLFFAMQEANVNVDAPEALLDLTDDFLTITNDLKVGNTTIEEFIQKIEKVIEHIEKKT